MPYYVYILECADTSLYTGITTNIERRIAEHNAHTGAKYTKTRTPVKLKYLERQEDRSAASKREYFIKQLSRSQKLELIASYERTERMRDEDERYEHIVHPLEPFYKSDSRVLVLGSFPSVKTRSSQFFYGHPQNRFWPLMALLSNDETPQTKEEKIDFLSTHHIALYDVIYECDIIGSSDASIKNVVPTNLDPILQEAPIELIVTNGGLATKLFKKYQAQTLGRTALGLPSTSPANARFSLEKLAEKWKPLEPFLS
ncbi:MAG: DNA-deoxyinosine glycosylase [Coriobacteriia bacterium]|nr:DNA-deoxyinosine glycosylase [Coriobacteriia bacterium]